MKFNNSSAKLISWLILTFLIVQANAQPVLYRLELIKTEGGRVASFLETHKAMAQANFFDGWSVQEPHVGQLIQGNHWEIFSLHPMISYGAYFSPNSLTKRREAHGQHHTQVAMLADMAEFKEDLFVVGPPLEVMNPLFKQHPYLYVQEYQLQAAAKKKVQALIDKLVVIQKDLKQPLWHPLFADAGSDTDLVILSFHGSMSEALQAHSNAQKNPSAAKIIQQIKQLALNQVTSLVALEPQ